MSKITYKHRPFRNLHDLTQAFPDEASYREYYTKVRWKDGIPVCPYCGHREKIYRYKNGKIYKCSECEKQFTVTVGTIFQKTHLPLSKWFMAIYILSSHRKGISSYQLGRDLGIKQPTAWFMAHRIRRAMGKRGNLKRTLTRLVEADETYIGGRHRGKRGRGSDNKKPVFGIVERGGSVFLKPVNNTKRKTLQPIFEKNVKKDSVVMTDEWWAYTRLNGNYEHHFVKHKNYEWVRGEVHTNTIEGVWSLFKRWTKGIHHWISHKHLFRYCSEFQFRYNTRKFPEDIRFKMLLSLFSGLTLPLKALIS